MAASICSTLLSLANMSRAIGSIVLAIATMFLRELASACLTSVELRNSSSLRGVCGRARLNCRARFRKSGSPEWLPSSPSVPVARS